MNPFTRFIARSLRSRSLKRFVQRWDALEALVIRVYRASAATETDEAEYGQLREWLNLRYPAWRDQLQPHWRGALRGGQLSPDDPFVFLCAPEYAHNFAGSWAHMQALPTAREALNRLILENND